MKKVLKNIRELSEWNKTDCQIVKRLVYNPHVLNDLLVHMGILDVIYGHDRDIHKGIGGYTVIITNDDNKELVSEYKAFLEQYNLNIWEYEICDTYDNDNGDKVSIFVHLLSADCGLVVVTIMKNNNENVESVINE